MEFNSIFDFHKKYGLSRKGLFEGYNVSIVNVDDAHCDYNADSEIRCEEYYFKDKKDAYDFFKKRIGPYSGGRDFWSDFELTDACVSSINIDEAGITYNILHKWENFDKEYPMYWKYNDKKYLTDEALAKENPEFEGCGLCTDKPFMTSNIGTYADIGWDY